MYKLPFHFKLYICGFFGVPEPQGARCFGPLGVGAALTTVKDALKTRSRSRKKKYRQNLFDGLYVFDIFRFSRDSTEEANESI